VKVPTVTVEKEKITPAVTPVKNKEEKIMAPIESESDANSKKS
jgi:hypothetical protein